MLEAFMSVIRQMSVAVLLAMALVSAGCGGDEGGAGANAMSETDATATLGESQETEGGSHSSSAASTPDTGNLGVPIAPSADALSTMESGAMTMVQFIVPLDERQATISFYDEWTGGQAEEYQRTEAESGGVSWQNDPDLGGVKHIIALLSPLEGDDFVTVTITTGPAE